MKQHTAESRDYFAPVNDPLLDEAASSAEKVSYARALRTIGLALEKHRFAAFGLRVEDDTYVVKGIIPSVELLKPSLFRSFCDLFIKPWTLSRRENKTDELELRYSHRELEEMDHDVRMQRSETPEIPDPHSISQLLRGIGCYLDKRAHSKLVGVSIKDRWVTIKYQSSNGQLLKTHEDIEYFYNFWVKMYLQRSSRPSVPQISAPTVWDES
jgi:hypothetical protein